MVSTENMHTNNIIWTVLVIFRKIYIHIHKAINETREHRYERENGEMCKKDGRRKGREKSCNFNPIPK